MQWGYCYLPAFGRRKTSIGAVAYKRTGMELSIGTMQGVVHVRISQDENGRDVFYVTLNKHSGGKKNNMCGQLVKVLWQGFMPIQDKD